MAPSSKDYQRSKEKQFQENEAQKNHLCDAFLTHALFDGYTKKSAQKAFKDCDLHFDYFPILFPQGIDDMILHFSHMIDAKMLEELSKYDLKALKIRERIYQAVKTRLTLMSVHRKAMLSGLAYLSNPLRTSLSLKMLYQTVDEIWHWAGDQSTDYNFYTKRGLLAGVYTSTALCWMNDDSKDQIDTWSFLERRIDNVLKIGKTMNDMKNFCKKANICFFQDFMKKA